VKLAVLVLLTTLTAFAQQPIPEEQQLQIDRMRAYGQSPVNMIQIQAVHFADGTPARGIIACNGWWRKFDEKEDGGWSWPFKTDSRGVIIMNPWVDTYGEDDPLICKATDIHGHTGSASVEMPAQKMLIQVR
jgi:SH3-like domain-containing protein